MKKVEWDAMEARRKDGLVLTTLWTAENGKPIDIRWHESDDEIFYGEYIRSGRPWETHEIEAIQVPWFVADRNACALVLDEIERRGAWVEFMDAFTDEDHQCVGSAGERFALRIGMTADPDTICYAAVRAVE